MGDPFESSRLKLARGKKHIRDLERELDGFLEAIPETRVIEPDPEYPERRVHKVKLTRTVPGFASVIAGDAASNLRASLDHVAYAVAVASGKIAPKFTAFPFAGSAAQFENALGRSKDIPQEIRTLFRAFQPYKGGNDLLWSLNEICVRDKHIMLAPVGVGTVRQGLRTNTVGYYSVPEEHAWDSAKQEMVLITLGPDTNFKYEFNFEFFVAFNEIQTISGKPAVPVLDEMAGIVEGILLAIEAEAARLGFVR